MTSLDVMGAIQNTIPTVWTCRRYRTGTGSVSNVPSSELLISQCRTAGHSEHTIGQTDEFAASNDECGTETKLAHRIGLVSGSRSGILSTLTSTFLSMKNLPLSGPAGGNENGPNAVTSDYGSDVFR